MAAVHSTGSVLARPASPARLDCDVGLSAVRCIQCGRGARHRRDQGLDRCRRLYGTAASRTAHADFCGRRTILACDFALAWIDGFSDANLECWPINWFLRQALSAPCAPWTGS